jgi:1-acyl-sn-glycerol-3-phosphate acyltransferase
MLIGLGGLALVCLVWLPFAVVLYPLLPRQTGQRLGRLAISLFFRGYLHLLALACACRFDLDELDRLRDQGPLILAANHPSLLDAVVIVSRLPNALCVMKASLMDNLLFGSATRLARYVRNDGILQLIGHSGEALNEGAILVLFPEGSRTRHFPIDPLPQTVGMLARRSKVPVQVVLLDYSSPYLGKAWPLFRPPALPLKVRARLGKCFDAPTDHRAFTDALEAYFRQEVRTPQTIRPHV